MGGRVLRGLVLALGVALATPAGALSFTEIYAFGDSLSDVGNAGIFSNGPVWIQQLAPDLGLSVSPSNLGGNVYAVGGATTSGVLSTQVPDYLGDAGGVADPGALYVIMAGGNDAFSAVSPATAAGNVITAISSLSAAGAQYFLVSNLPDLSLVPAAYGSAAAQAFSLSFNASLASGLAGLSGPTLFLLDLYAGVNDVVANPASYGLTNVNTPCWNGVSACATPDTYLFWDTLHPTTAGHGLIAEVAFALVPEPGGLALLAAVLVVAFQRRRQLP